MAEEKVCTITNGKFTYYMDVDGKHIAFSGGYAEEYFEKHYRDLGYKIVLKNDNKGDED